MAKLPNDLGVRVCEKMGLDPNTVTRIHLDLSAGGLPTMEITVQDFDAAGEFVEQVLTYFTTTLSETEG